MCAPSCVCFAERSRRGQARGLPSSPVHPHQRKPSSGAPTCLLTWVNAAPAAVAPCEPCAGMVFRVAAGRLSFLMAFERVLIEVFAWFLSPSSALRRFSGALSRRALRVSFCGSCSSCSRAPCPERDLNLISSVGVSRSVLRTSSRRSTAQSGLSTMTSASSLADR